MVWRFGSGGPAPVGVRVAPADVVGKSSRVVAAWPEAAVNNLQVLHSGPTAAPRAEPMTFELKPWDIRWNEVVWAVP